MSENNGKLHIHAKITPETTEKTPPKAVRWRCLPHPLKKNRQDRKLTYGDRLLRNSALACAVLLGVLAVGNIDHPLAKRTSETIRRALTMRIDLDESIGQLTFVRNLMPESALVFLNLSAESEFALPVHGELTHSYSDAQPWLTFECPSGSEVTAVADGTVTAVSSLPHGAFGVLIDHGGGMESVLAYLETVDVQPGDAVLRAQPVGSSGAMLYFELREGETTADPSERMGL